MILRGNAFTISLKNKFVHCVITSPPYWGLRDYGVSGQLGLEKTPEEYVEKMVQVFREVKRVLRDDGTLWLNMGDSYASGKGSCFNPGGGESSFKDYRKEAGVIPLKRLNVSEVHAIGLKPKDLVGIPWRVAFALQADGWYLRSDIIWAKPNPMPESVTDRPTKAHEYIFLLTKSPKYFFDQEAVREKSLDTAGVLEIADDGSIIYRKPWNDNKGQDKKTMLGSWASKYGSSTSPGGRNIRTVWNIATQPFSEAHFATFPEELVRRCLFAGCPVGGIVFDPFFGSGTVGVVAQKYNRRFIGLELKPEYCQMSKRRIYSQPIAMI